jgi:hypothetical protein
MRSRFWLDGDNVRIKGLGGAGAPIGRALGRIVRLTDGQAADLLVHCAQQMNHLARFLTELYKTFANRNTPSTPQVGRAP